jgi:Flp pilus assembly protein TadG
MLLFGVLDLAMIFIASTAIDAATGSAARQIRTGVFQQGAKTSAADFKNTVCNNVTWISTSDCKANLSVDVRTFASFSAITLTPPVKNGQIDQTQLAFTPGTSCDIVLVRVFYPWTLLAPVLEPRPAEPRLEPAAADHGGGVPQRELHQRAAMQLTPLSRLGRDRRGAAALEFALLLPILLLLYFGVAEVTQAVLTERRASHAASTIGDLVAQSSTITQAQVGDVFTIGKAIVYPYPTGPLKMRITSIVADAQGVTTVAWSQGDGIAALAKGSPVAVPANVIAANQSVIKAEVKYTYTPAVGYVLKSSMPFNSTYYLRPRLSDQVACADC